MHQATIQTVHSHRRLLLSQVLVGLSAILGFLFLASQAHAAVTGVLLPTGEGANLQWTTSTGASHYTLVDETVCNGVADYVRTTTLAQRDSYTLNLSSIPNGSTITAVSITPCASRNNSGGGLSTMNVFYRLNGVLSADQGAYALTGTTPVALATTTFSGLSTVKSSTTALEVGAVYSAGTRGARLSRVATVVTYTQLAPTVATVSASPSATTTATTTLYSALLFGNANPNGAATTGWFRYSTVDPGTCSDTFGTRAPSAGGTSLGSGVTTVAYNRNITGLTSATTYYYCAIASNSGGTGLGGVQSFVTP
jgi:hypothetical protein